MREAGITDVNAVTRPIDLWPTDKEGRVLDLNPNQAKKHLLSGRRFLMARNGIATIHDIPEGTNVVLHARRETVKLCVCEELN